MFLHPGIDAGWEVGAPWARRFGFAVLEVGDCLWEGEAEGYEGSGDDDGNEMSQVACVGRFEEGAETGDGVEEEDRAVEEAVAAEERGESEGEAGKENPGCLREVGLLSG